GGFLVDADAVSCIAWFDRAIIATKHADEDIVKEAWDQQRTIVTSNGRDFLRYIRGFQNPPNKPQCHDLWGLVVVPNAQFERQKGLRSIQHGLNVLRTGTLRWPGAAFLNLYIRVTADGEREVYRFKRCPFCEHPERGVHIAEPWNTWYRGLPLVG